MNGVWLLVQRGSAIIRHAPKWTAELTERRYATRPAQQECGWNSADLRISCPVGNSAPGRGRQLA
jgi:hypothetical protein